MHLRAAASTTCKFREREDYYKYHRPHSALDGQTAYERLLAKTTRSLAPESSDLT
jgi:hypothetical protein